MAGGQQGVTLLLRWVSCLTSSWRSVGWACWGYARRTLGDGDVSANLGVPVGLFVYLMAAMLLLAAAMHLMRCFVAPPPPAATEAYE